MNGRSWRRATDRCDAGSIGHGARCHAREHPASLPASTWSVMTTRPCRRRHNRRGILEWHLHKPVALQMSISVYPFTSLGTRYFQPGVGLGSAFSSTRFYSSGSVADSRLGDEPEQSVGTGAQVDAMRSPFGPQPYSVLEAQLPRMNVGIQRRTSTPSVVLRLRRFSSTFRRCAYS